MNKYKFLIILICIFFLLFSFLSWDIFNLDSVFMGGSFLSGFSLLKPDNFKKIVDQKEVLVLDVRTRQEYEVGHLPSAINIDIYASDFWERISELDRDQKYAVYCRSGNRSSQAINMMKDMGFSQLVELDGGVIAWTRSGQGLCSGC